MVATLIVCVLVGLITFFLVFKQGLFSAAIVAFLSLASSMIAWNYYERLANLLGDWGLSAYAPQTVSFLVLFTLSLLILRELADRLIRGNMKFHFLIDRIGSGFFGLIAALVIAGNIAVGIQMLPVSGIILGFNRCPNLRNPDDDKMLFPKADSFVVSAINHASSYGFAGKTRFEYTHPDMLRELYLNRLALDPASRREAAPDALKVIDAAVIQNKVYDVISDQPFDLSGNEVLITTSFTVAGGRDKKKGRGAKDVDGRIRFVMGNIRLLGYHPGSNEPGIAAYPVGIIYPGDQAAFAENLDEGKVIAANQQINLLFKWPADPQKISPSFLEFKRTSIDKIRLSNEQPDTNTQDLAALYKDYSTGTISDLTGDIKAAPYRCEKITIITPSQEQPLLDMKIPTPEEIDQARSAGKLTVAKPETSDAKGYRQIHCLVPFSSKRSSGEEMRGLSVPTGFSLVLLRVENIDSAKFALPVLIDTYNQKHYPAGWTAISNVNNSELVEFAYDIKAVNSDDAFGGNFLLKEKQASRVGATFFYLFPNQPPIGIVGCRARAHRSDPGQFFHLSSAVDLLLVSQ